MNWIGSRKEKCKLLKIKENVDHVGLLQLLVQLKPERLFKMKKIQKITLNNNWLIVIVIVTMDVMEVCLRMHILTLKIMVYQLKKIILMKEKNKNARKHKEKLKFHFITK